MCGIVGYATSKNKTDYEKFFKQALVADVLRGMDSTGIIVGDDKQYTYFKKAVNAIDFLDMKTASTVVNKLGLNRPAFMIGHNRAATVGGVTSENAHPFEHGDIVGVHNGTLRTFSRLDKSRDFSTDSEALYYNLSKRPLVEVLGDVKGAYALVWYDNAEGTINLIRNDDRPLHIAKVKGDDAVLWASESGMLRWIASRNGVELENMIQPHKNVHIKIHLNSEAVAEFEFEQLDVKDNYPVVQNNYNGGNKGNHGSGGHSGYGGGSAARPKHEILRELGITYSKDYEVYCHSFEPYSTTEGYGVVKCFMTEDPWIEVHLRAQTKEMFQKLHEKTFPVKLREVVCEDGSLWNSHAIGNLGRDVLKSATYASYLGPNNTYLTKPQMASAVEKGCCICKNAISCTDFDFIDWIDNEPVCPDCIAHDAGKLEA